MLFFSNRRLGWHSPPPVAVSGFCITPHKDCNCRTEEFLLLSIFSLTPQSARSLLCLGRPSEWLHRLDPSRNRFWSERLDVPDPYIVNMFKSDDSSGTWCHSHTVRPQKSRMLTLPKHIIHILPHNIFAAPACWTMIITPHTHHWIPLLPLPGIPCQARSLNRCQALPTPLYYRRGNICE